MGRVTPPTLARNAELYDPVTGSSSAAGAFSTDRLDFTTTLLQSGKVLIVAGGYHIVTMGPLSVELYDPAFGTFAATGSLVTPRLGPTATLLPNGTVLVAGGEYGEAPGPAELYDPATGLFTATGSMAMGRIGRHTATLLPSGKVLIAGGWAPVDGKEVEREELSNPTVSGWRIEGERPLGTDLALESAIAASPCKLATWQGTITFQCVPIDAGASGVAYGTVAGPMSNPQIDILILGCLWMTPPLSLFFANTFPIEQTPVAHELGHILWTRCGLESQDFARGCHPLGFLAWVCGVNDWVFDQYEDTRSGLVGYEIARPPCDMSLACPGSSAP